MTSSLLIAHTAQLADDSALLEWKWDKVGELRLEYRRPDTGERVRFLPDMPGTLQGLRWNTTVYLGQDWKRRNDASQVMGYLDAGFFIAADPQLPPPRARRPRDVISGADASVLRRLLGGRA